MESIRVSVIERDDLRSRGIASVLIAPDLLVRRYATIEDLLTDGRGSEVIIVSYELCCSEGAEPLSSLQRSFPRARLLVTGSLDVDTDAAQLFSAGAHGCFRWSLGPERLAEAVRHVASGKVWGSREALHSAVGRTVDKQVDRQMIGGEEVRLLHMLEAGLTNKEIGQRLGFAESTVKSRFNRLYRKFGVSSRVQLLTTAIRKGVLLRGEGRE